MNVIAHRHHKGSVNRCRELWIVLLNVTCERMLDLGGNAGKLKEET